MILVFVNLVLLFFSTLFSWTFIMLHVLAVIFIERDLIVLRREIAKASGDTVG